MDLSPNQKPANRLKKRIRFHTCMDLAELNQKWLRKTRLVVYVLAVVLALLVFAKNPDFSGIDSLSFANDFGFVSFIFISLALAVTPIKTLFPKFPFNASLVYARRAMGVSAFAFALVHAAANFVFLFDAKISAYMDFNAVNEQALVASSLAFTILLAMTATSTDWAVRKLGKRWNTLHKSIYLAYPLIIYHAIKAGADFTRTTLTGQAFVVIAMLVVLLELARVHKERQNKKKTSQAIPAQINPKEPLSAPPDSKK
ncbi:MAG: ferric reductase-like transmembrane domain-containing protein [Candidatus Diapherotrites archaeon]|nr:ferric reductase-like transmembrane domain-containing protein [Candidatus Diapherotrites archaeon]